MGSHGAVALDYEGAASTFAEAPIVRLDEQFRGWRRLDARDVASLGR